MCFESRSAYDLQIEIVLTIDDDRFVAALKQMSEDVPHQLALGPYCVGVVLGFGLYGPSSLQSLPNRCNLNRSPSFVPSRKTVRIASSLETISLSMILKAVTLLNCS